MRFKLLIVLSILVVTTKIYAQQKPLLTKTGGLIYCLDSAEFKISDFYYGQSKKDVIRILGKPDSVWVENGVSESNYYKGLRVYYNKKGTVYRIFASSEKLKTPNGIHTGLSKLELFKILGLKPNEIPSIKFENQFENCIDNIVFYVFYDESSILKVIGIEIIGVP
jgi:hypothetical protein